MSNNPCAWCALEIGARHPKGTSHGICQRHAEQLLEAAQKHAAFESLSQRLNEPISDVLLQREVYAAEDRVRRRWWHWLRTEPVPDDRVLPGTWTPKRFDQLIFSAGVLVIALGLGLIAGVLACAWGFWHGGPL